MEAAGPLPASHARASPPSLELRNGNTSQGTETARTPHSSATPPPLPGQLGRATGRSRRRLKSACLAVDEIQLARRRHSPSPCREGRRDPRASPLSPLLSWKAFPTHLPQRWRRREAARRGRDGSPPTRLGAPPPQGEEGTRTVDLSLAQRASSGWGSESRGRKPAPPPFLSSSLTLSRSLFRRQPPFLIVRTLRSRAREKHSGRRPMGMPPRLHPSSSSSSSSHDLPTPAVYRSKWKIKHLTGNNILDCKDGLITTLLPKVLKYDKILIMQEELNQLLKHTEKWKSKTLLLCVISSKVELTFQKE
ncbi:uncharacterized protein LOC112541843 [Python bivittatus]|uniref:Uncharacterized protein LOC112541843 n=1 Tax=Python bivittatus TaxID=176946 RepID=A0A9F5IP36_PYTBI|nr:uncharacterized protein LOC112541843 [Python bivittatus]